MPKKNELRYRLEVDFGNGHGKGYDGISWRVAVSIVKEILDHGCAVKSVRIDAMNPALAMEVQRAENP